MKTKSKIVAFDFDNVIHKYRKGWKDGSIYDDMNDEVLKLIRRILDNGHKVIIISTRRRRHIKRHFDQLNDHYDFELDMNFSTNTIPFRYRTFGSGLFGKNIFWNKKDVVGICNHKAVFDVFIDDRAINFNPLNGVDIETILSFEPIPHK